MARVMGQSPSTEWNEQMLAVDMEKHWCRRLSVKDLYAACKAGVVAARIVDSVSKLWVLSNDSQSYNWSTVDMAESSIVVVIQAQSQMDQLPSLDSVADTAAAGVRHKADERGITKEHEPLSGILNRLLRLLTLPNCPVR